MTLSARNDFLWLIAGRLLSAAVALATLRLVTTFLSPEQYGELALLISVQTFCGLFLVNPLGQYINLNTHTWFANNTLRSHLNLYWRYVLCVPIAGSLVVWLLIDPIADSQLPLMLLAMYVAVAVSTWNATLIPMLNMLGFRGFSVTLSLVTTCIGLLASVCIVLWQSSAIGWYVGQAIGLAVGGAMAHVVMYKMVLAASVGSKGVMLIDRRTIFSYCIPLAIATGLMWLQLSGYRFVIEHFWGLENLAYFAIGLQLSYQLWSLAESIAMQFLYPYFFQRISQGVPGKVMEEALSDLLSVLVPAYVLLLGLSVVAAPYLLKVLVSSQFYDGLKYFVFGAAVEFFRVSANLFGNAAHARRSTSSLILPYVVGVALIYSLLFFFAREGFEILWAGVALVIGAASMLLVLVLNMYKQLRFRLCFFRLIWTCICVLFMVAVSIYFPIVESLFGAAIMVSVLGAVGVFLLFVLMYKNPALIRMLDVKLR